MQFVVYLSKLGEKGLGLIELMISMGVSVTVMVVISQYFNDQNKSMRAVSQLLEVQSMQQDITRILGNGTNCTSFFAGRNGNAPSTLTNLIDSSGQVRYAVGQRYNAGLLLLSAMQMLPVPPASVANGRGQFAIELTYQRMADTSSQPQIKVRVPVFYEAGPTNLIATCSTNRQMINKGLDCVRPTNPPANPFPLPPGNGQERMVPCPAGYQVLGGGMEDQDICKCGLINTIIEPGEFPGFPDGGWRCREETNAGLTCYAICCRPAQ